MINYKAFSYVTALGGINLFYHTRYSSPLGGLTIVAQDDRLAGVWFDRQKYFAAGIGSIGAEENEYPLLKQCRTWFDRYFSGDRPDARDIPLVPPSTPLHAAILDELLSVPYGQVITCGELRTRVSRLLSPERAMSKMALNSALLRNPFAVIVPTHRVISTNGAIRGYAAGIEKKIWLLHHEGVDESRYYRPAGIRL